jgi:hypothetical protein
MASIAVSAAPLLLGLALGLRHALDPDHVAAMGNIVSREHAPGRSAVLGAFWGLGHTASLLAASIVVIALRIPVPARIAGELELLVAVMLVGLGIQSLLSASSGSPPARAPSARRPFVIGLVHGLAGSGGLALLVLPAMRDTGTALAYVALFAAGSAGGMALWSAALAWPLGRISRRSGRAGRLIPAVSGLASVVCGIMVAVQAA